MSIFQNLTKRDNLEKTEDRVGGYTPIATDVYEMMIKMMYAGKAQNSNAQNVTVIGDIDGKEYRETVYITNRDGENFYKDKNTGKNVPLPGFETIDDMCLLGHGVSLLEQATEEKIVKVYNAKEGKEVPTPVPMMVDMIGKKVKVGVQLVIEDKQKKDDSGKYVNTGETRKVNRISKVFHPETDLTVNEYLQEQNEPAFMDIWLDANKGKEINNAKGLSAGGGAGQSGRGAPNATKKLFGN